MDDLEEVYHMLLMLVKYEKLKSRFKLSEKKMASYLFRDNHDWFCLVVQDLTDNSLKGFLMYTFSNLNRAFHLTPSVHIDHLYLQAEYRNVGVGEKLIDELKKRAKINGVNRIEVYCMVLNKIGNHFYNKIGAKKLDYVNLYRIRV